MRGIVLAGGTGSRLMPLTKATNKHLLPVGDKPMIFHPIEKLVEAGITDIMIVTGTEHMGAMVQCLGSGKDFGCKLLYAVQDEAGGIAQALALCKTFASTERLCVILGDNIFEDTLGDMVQSFEGQSLGAKVVLKTVPDPERYGVAFVNEEEHKVHNIIEKPKTEDMLQFMEKTESKPMAVTGVYMYDHTVFSIIETLKPSDRGEFEITDVNKKYLEWGILSYSVFQGYWTDAGTMESIKIANKLTQEKR